LGDNPAVAGQELLQLLLVRDLPAADQPENRLLPSVLVTQIESPCSWSGRAHQAASNRSELIDTPFSHYYALSVNRIRVGVLGASGYAGQELCRLVAQHPQLTLAFATANEQRGATVRVGAKTLQYIATDDAPLQDVELVFSALPHGASKIWVERTREAGARAVDLSADLRPGNGCEGIPYGLTELNRALVAGASVVANPGCYPTSILVALAPLVERGLVAADATVVVNSASGVTGAGNSPKRELLFGEVVEDFRAYGVGNTHRHLNEMRATLDAWGTSADIVFTPHLLPVARGILSTIVVPLSSPLDDRLGPWREMYEGEPFIEIAPDTPTLRDVRHRNVVRISATPLAGLKSPALLVTSAIDNLMKGAAGQAVQNANLMLGLEETAGLPA
jgi:N-acetyl-gamma-glutamyl-phosphate reductase